MKLRNKETGEMGTPRVDYQELYVDTENGYTYHYKSLQKMCEEWEDYEEPKEYWRIDCDGEIEDDEYEGTSFDKDCKAIGNHFETREEAELAVRKLKAWKRLKDKGFRFDGWDENHHNFGIIEFSFDKVENNVWNFEKDLDICFGGEE